MYDAATAVAQHLDLDVARLGEIFLQIDRGVPERGLRLGARGRKRAGKILHYHTPGGLGVRVDSAVYQGYTIPPYYDSLVGKLIVHGKTRGECLMRLKRALDEFVVDGIETTLPLFRALVREQGILDGNYHIRWLEHFLAEGGMAE